MAAAVTMPDRAPLYQAPPIPYRGVRAIYAWTRADPDGIRRALPPAFEPVGDIIQFFVMHSPNAGFLGSYDEGGVVIPCRYDAVTGAHVAYEYVNSDDSLCVGREVWGYPKKLARVGFAEDRARARGTVARRGAALIDIRFEEGGTEVAAKPVLQPRLQVKRFPRADGRGFDVDQVIRNDLKETEILERRTGTCRIEINSNPDDPIGELGPLDVLGGEFVVANFVLDYGMVLADLAPGRGAAAE